MKKKKVTKRMMMPIVATVAVCAFTVAGFSTMSYLQGNPYKMSNENGETYIPFEAKADIVDNIYENKGQLVILEIVPYENAGIMEMLVGTDYVKAKLEANKEVLFEQFKDNALVDGNNTFVTVGGALASYHPFDIVYDSSADEYSVSYPNLFISSLVDTAEDMAVYNYLVDNVEVRTVVAGELTEKDLEDVSLIYVSNCVQDEEIVTFNRFIDGEISANDLSSIAGIEGIGAYEKVNGSYKELTMNDISDVWYDSYVKSADGTYISNDMSWDMVEKVVEYIYAGNEYTEGQPIPSIINYGTPTDKSANVYKLMNLMVKTSNEEKAEFNGMSTYYKNVLETVKDGVLTYEGKEYSDWSDSKVPLFDIRCVVDENYVSNFSYVMQGSVDDMLFSIGTPDSFDYEITDNGSAGARDVAADGDNTYTSSEALTYLLNGGGNVAAAYDSSKRTGKRAVGSSSMIRVLEIQPCQDFLYEFTGYNVKSKKSVVSNIKNLGVALGLDKYSSISDSASSYQNFLDKGNAKIEFKCVTPQEFNGLNEDLVASYDIIVVGNNTGQMNTADGKTIWNDKALDGYIYLAYGDLVKGQDFLLGLLPRDYAEMKASQATGGTNGYTFESTSGALWSTKDWKSNLYVYTMRNSNIWTPLLRGSKSNTKYWVFKTAYIYNDYDSRDDFFADSDGNTRTVGNDITNKKLKELVEYLSVKRPVVLADDLYKCPTSSKNKTAYPTSKMYAFAEQAIEYDQVIKFSDIADELSDIIHENTLKITSYNMEYEKAGVRYSAPSIKYVSGGVLDENCIVEGIEQFYYKVTFKAKPGTKYYVKAIIDKDTDGRFDSEPTIDDYNEVYYARKIVADSDTVSLELNIKLAVGYNGMFGWKILVEELGAGDIRMDAVSEQGYTVVTGDTKIVKALQIAPSGPTLNMSVNEVIQYENTAGWSDVYVYFWNKNGNQIGNNWPGQKINTINSEGKYEFNYKAYNSADFLVFNNGKTGSSQKKSCDYYLEPSACYSYINYDGVTRKPTKKINLDNQATPTFISLMHKATEQIKYDVQVDYISANAFEKLFEGSDKKYTKGSSYGTARDYLTSNGYNMLVFGFKDSWGGEDICNDYGAMDCIVDYIEHGGSVLMSHDVLTFYNNPNYGITINSKKKIVTRTGKNGSMILSLKLRSLIGMDVYGVTTIPNMNADILAANNVPMKSDKTYIGEIQGFTDWHIYRYNEVQKYSSTRSNSKILTMSPWKGAESYMPRSGEGGKGVSPSYDEVTGAGDTMVTTSVDEVNRGQISMYPFNTTSENGTLTIAKTHPQYYRLNMEDDDLVVWYTIGPSYDNKGKLLAYNQFYVDSGKDAANNYYIYSKGNITYTGAGHSEMNVESELKLFVNTVIRAAMAGNFTPKITVVNGSSTKDADTFVVFPNALDDEIKVDFIPFDEDLATRDVVKDSYATETEIREHIGRFTSGAIYYVTSGGDKLLLEEYSRTGNYLLNGEVSSITIVNPFAGNPSSINDPTAFRKTSEYKNADKKTKNMYECYLDYITHGSVDISIEVSDHGGATGKSTVTIVEHALFDLD